MPKQVFIGSAQADATHVDILKKHLKLYERQNLIQIWDESMIRAGEERNSRIEEELHAAEIILLLFSADLLAEDFVWGAEMTKVLEKVKRKEVQFIPILVRPSGFVDTQFSTYAAVPERNKPISNYNNKDEAWTIVVEQIKRSIQHTPNPTTTQHQKPEPEMIPQTLIDEVNNFISKGNTDKAIDAIILWASINNHNQVKSDALIQKARLEKLKREEMLGMLSFSEAAREHAKINNDVLSLLKMIIAELSDKGNDSEENNPKAPPQGKLKILMLTANPAGTTELNLNKEHARIAKELENAPDRFLLRVKRSVNKTEFQQFTQLEKPYILHFSGHNEGGEDGGIVVQDDEKRGEAKIRPEALGVLFKFLTKSVKIPIELVVLNACHSEEQAQAIANHVPYVIGTTVSIEDEAAIAFSVGFYFQLAISNDIELSYESGRTQSVLEGAQEKYFIIYKNGAKLEI